MLTVFTSLLLVSGQGPERLAEKVIVSATATASCFEEGSGKLVGSMLVRRPIVVSADGKYEAYAENEAVAGREYECANTAKLFVKKTGEDGFRQVFLQEPTPYELFNDIKVVDWSPDSRHLLADLFVGQWGSDFGGSNPLLYDAWNGTFSPQEMVDRAFRTHSGHDCPYGEQTLGFFSDGGLVLKVYPRVDEEGTLDPASCVKKEGLWLLQSNGLSPLPDTYRVRRYGQLLKGESNK